jgi:hypothetical protein
MAVQAAQWPELTVRVHADTAAAELCGLERRAYRLRFAQTPLVPSSDVRAEHRVSLLDHG